MAAALAGDNYLERRIASFRNAPERAGSHPDCRAIRRSLVETAIGRYKALIGPRLRARGLAAQQIEATIGVTILNRMLEVGRPNSIRCSYVKSY